MYFQVSITHPTITTGAALLQRLECPDGMTGQSGITFGGLTFDGSTTGQPQGVPVTETVLATAGSFTFSIAFASAVVLHLPAAQ
jgi:hypothetical protein